MNQLITSTLTLQQSEQTDHNTSSKVHKPPDILQKTPPSSKKRYEIMKEPIFLSSRKYSTYKFFMFNNRDDHLIPRLPQDNSTFKAQLTSHFMHPTDYTFRLYDKNHDCFTSIASKKMSPYQY